MGRKLLLDKINVPDIKGFDVYRANGGYASVEKALKMAPNDVIEQVKKSGLRGRGGAGFPTGMKWGFLDKKSGRPKYLVCNADESEPGTFKDRYLMEYLPHVLIEGKFVYTGLSFFRELPAGVPGAYRLFVNLISKNE